MSHNARESKPPVGLLVSLTLLGQSVVLFAASYAVDPWKHRISISQGFHVSLWGRGADARILFFNNAEYGPYRGSMIQAGAVGSPPPAYPKVIGFGDCLGVYYRHIVWPQKVLWTLMLSLWYPVAVFGLCSVITGWRWRIRRARH